MPAMRYATRGDDALRRVHLFLRMHSLWRAFAAQGRRLLRVLLVWFDTLPAHSDRTCGRRGRRVLPNMTGAAHNDWVKQPVAAALWWCLPLCLGILANVLLPSPRIAAVAWAVVFAWMGTGCVLNALRCRRLHCYLSGPVFFLGALAAGLLAAEVFATRLSSIVSATLLLALLSFVPETLWDRHLPRRSEKD